MLHRLFEGTAASHQSRSRQVRAETPPYQLLLDANIHYAPCHAGKGNKKKQSRRQAVACKREKKRKG